MVVAQGHRIDQDVDAPEGRHRLVDHSLHIVGLGDIGHDRQAAHTPGFDLAGHIGGILGRGLAIDHDRSPRLRQAIGDGASHAPGCARHDRDFSSQLLFDAHERSFYLSE